MSTLYTAAGMHVGVAGDVMDRPGRVFPVSYQDPYPHAASSAVTDVRAVVTPVRGANAAYCPGAVMTSARLSPVQTALGVPG